VGHLEDIKNAKKFQSYCLKERDLLVNLAVDGRIIFKLTLRL
jgi:hypothetical protein